MHLQNQALTIRRGDMRQLLYRVGLWLGERCQDYDGNPQHGTPARMPADRKQLLYRIDVKESLVKETFQHSTQQEELTHELTVLIIERLKQKAEIRRHYSSQ